MVVSCENSSYLFEDQAIFLQTHSKIIVLAWGLITGYCGIFYQQKRTKVIKSKVYTW